MVATGDNKLKAEGKADQVKAKLKQTGEKIKDAFKEALPRPRALPRNPDAGRSRLRNLPGPLACIGAHQPARLHLIRHAGTPGVLPTDYP